jgi:molybdopterin-guanine dinucleotide biosynthesis protein A
MPALAYCTGAILIGGHSSRMGLSKHLLRLPDGRTMLEHVRQAIAPLCPKVVAIDSQGGAAAGETIVRDIRPSAGPLGGIEALLASGIDAQYLICPCDVPLITTDLLRLLLAEAQALASVFRVEGRKDLEPLPARIRAEALPVVRRLLNAQQRAAWKLMRELAPHVVMISEAQAVALHNVNTKGEYEEAAQLMGAAQPRGAPTPLSHE